MKRRLGYLSGAPRVSTRPTKESVAPRAHVLGIIEAFRELDWDVKPFIVGDRVSQKWTAEGSQKTMSSSFLNTLAVDVLRLVLGTVNARRAWRELGGQVDWVYERSAVLQSLGWLFKRRGTPWILETNGPFFYEAKVERKSMVLSRLAHWLEVRAYRGCDVLVCVSDALKEILVHEAGVEPEKVVTLPNGVDTSFFDPDQHEPKRLSENFTIGYVGSLVAWQALDLLLEALGDLRAEGIDASLTIVGGGPMRETLEAQARQIGVSDSVTFVGWTPRQDVPRFIAGFDVGYSGQVLMQVGKMYHSPLKIYEYMSMGKPVVASAFEDAQRVTRGGELGFLYQAGDKDDLKRALVEAYRSRKTLPEMGREARQEVLRHHSWVARVTTLISEVERIRGET